MPIYSIHVTVNTDEGENEWSFEEHTVERAFFKVKKMQPNWTSMVITVVRRKGQ